MQEIPPPPPPGISMEEANELRENIEKLEGELVEMRAELAAKEDANNQLSKQGERGKGDGHNIITTTWSLRVLFSGPGVDIYKGRKVKGKSSLVPKP